MQTNHLAILALATALSIGTVESAWASPKAKKPPAALAQKMEQDRKRDAATLPKTNPQLRTVQRYTQWEQAQREAKTGIAPGSHMTPGVHPGRPLSPFGAARRYGLPKTPTARETILIPAGTPLRTNKALGGQPGVGELTSPKTIPPAAIARVDRLPKDHSSP